MKISLRVEGMTCRSCEQLVEETLMEITGVKNVSVSQKGGRVVITYNENKVDKMKLIKAIKEEGYKVCK